MGREKTLRSDHELRLRIYARREAPSLQPQRFEGKKVSIIRGICNKAAAIMECGERVVIDPEIPCKSGSAFQSIMASGTMKILQGSEALHALEVFYRHQTGVVPPFPEGAENFVTMFCLECDEYTCKICVK